MLKYPHMGVRNFFHAGACCVFGTVFSTHRHPASTNPAHPVSVPIRLPSDKSSAVTSLESHIYIANATRFQVHTRYTHMRMASGLFSWSMAAGLLAFSSRQFALAINHEPLSASHYFSFLSKRSGRRMPPAERSAFYIILLRVV